MCYFLCIINKSNLVELFIEDCECPYMLLILALTEKIERTVQIEASTVEIEERGVKLRLTVVDTPGYGDAINSQDWYGIFLGRMLMSRWGILKFKLLGVSPVISYNSDEPLTLES